MASARPPYSPRSAQGTSSQAFGSAKPSLRTCTKKKSNYTVSDRGFTDSDLTIMSQINECAKQTNGSRVLFGLIANKIMDPSTHDIPTFRRGFTKHISEELVKVNGKDVRQIDVPGLFEPSNKETQINAQKLNEALSLGHSYRIYFVLKAGNRGPDDSEMVMMSKISECVRKSDGSQMSFGVIVNQVPSDKVEDMYKDLTKDNFRSMFDGLSIPGFTFDINIDSVIMLSYDELGLEQNRFRDTLAEEVLKHPAAAIRLVNEISFCNNDLKRYQTALLNRVGRAILSSRLLVGSANQEIFRSYVHIAQKATKAMARTVVNRTRDYFASPSAESPSQKTKE
ncbi:hypothetical protein BGZ59_007204 [Podila verticillata]|nr:hypothetical protein BGZ59_007204 [Podila verticillata]